MIERDSKSSTYKFALLRGIIDIIQEDSPFIHVGVSRVSFPLGLLVEKWMIYYYPLLDSPLKIPQNYGSASLAFQSELLAVIDAFRQAGGLSVFYQRLKGGALSTNEQQLVLALAKKLGATITQMPMKYLGRSVSDAYYSIFQYQTQRVSWKQERVELQSLIRNLGSFSIPFEYYQVFQFLGSFITGQDSILLKWAEFSVNASGRDIRIEQVVHEVLKNPVTERQVLESKKIYRDILQQEGAVRCVWTNELIRQFDVDHALPFSVWKNNDLWNLLPSKTTTNNQKRDLIPSPHLIQRQQDTIVYYWHLLGQHYPERFRKELQVSLLGEDAGDDWEQRAIHRLQHNCDYLINKRGYREWTL